MALFLSTLYALLFAFSCSLFSSEYQIDDKKLLDLIPITKPTYYKNKDINLESIIPYHKIITYFTPLKPKIFIIENYQNAKLIHYFESYVNVLKKVQNKLLESKDKRIYFSHPNDKKLYYGVDFKTLTGRNLIGKIVQKIRDEPSYIQKTYQKIHVADDTINELHQTATEKQKFKSLLSGWQGLENAVYFYDKGKQYYEFTNFFESEVYADGVIWPTSEHYYQAMKFTKKALKFQSFLNLQVKIANKKETPTARNAYMLGQQNKYDPDWPTRRLNTMIKIVWLKFNQHESLKKLLLRTGDKILVEDTAKAKDPKERDKFYGAGEEYDGENWLGCILMAVRDKLRTEEQTAAPVSPAVPSNPTISSTNSSKIQQPTGQSDSNLPKRRSQETTYPSERQQKSFFAWLWEWFKSLFPCTSCKS